MLEEEGKCEAFLNMPSDEMSGSEGERAKAYTFFDSIKSLSFVCYRGSGSKAFYNIMKHVLKCPFVSLPNLIAGTPVVAELLMHHCNPAEIAA